MKLEGERLTRWVVAVQIPPVSAWSERPMLITSVPGMGGAGIQMPALFCTSSPWCSVAWRRYVRKDPS